ncbi:MAG: hypothetical protein F6J87_29245 [Spirulina sp. SIO3F2]|nr:hypothetical protein [Spirulina sp. SIO3F2]
MNLDLKDPQTKAALTEVMVDLLKNNRELVNDIILEAIEDIGLAAAIQEGQSDELVDESEIFAILDSHEDTI